MSSYVLALDESGRAHIRDPRGARYGFVEGGLAIPADQVARLEASLAEIRRTLGGPDQDEVKSFEFVRGFTWLEETARTQHALEEFGRLLRRCDAVPVGMFLDKAKFWGPPDGALILATKKGGVRVNQQLMFESLTLSFGQFLAARSSTGRVVHDELRSETEQSRWLENLEHVKSRHPNQMQPFESIEFVDSASSGLVQAADIVVGMLLSHFEQKLEIGGDALERLKTAERNALLVHVAP